MAIPVGVAVGLGLKLAMAGYDAMKKGQDTLDPEQEAALRAEGREQLAEWDRLFED